MSQAQFGMLPIDRIKPNPRPSRSVVDEERLQQLAQSIKRHGILQPLAVKKEGDDYILIAGKRRLLAAQMTELNEVPVYFIDGDPLELSLVENLHQDPLHPVEQAESILKYRKWFRFTQDKMSECLNVAKNVISQGLKLFKLSPHIMAKCKGDPNWTQEKLLILADTKREAMEEFFQKTSDKNTPASSILTKINLLKLELQQGQLSKLNDQEKQWIRENLSEWIALINQNNDRI